MKGILEISIVPIKLNNQSASLSDVVAKFFKLLSLNSKVKVEIYPTSTVVYGEIEDVFEAFRNAVEKTVSRDEIPRIVAFLKLDIRVDKEATPQAKYESVIKKIDNLS
ncbi:MAG: MTH1187 family thiamine-binding protein [Brevinematales bacterium]|nr:MTH1187 family thiamine-binding protein [Brevinematales bacterium]